MCPLRRSAGAHQLLQGGGGWRQAQTQGQLRVGWCLGAWGRCRCGRGKGLGRLVCLSSKEEVNTIAPDVQKNADTGANTTQEQQQAGLSDEDGDKTTVVVRACSLLTLRMRRRQPTTAAAAEMKVTVAAKTAVATLCWLQLQLRRQVIPVQALLHVQCACAAAAATSEQLEAVGSGSAVHAILQHVVILFPALRGCGAACMLRLSCSRRRSCIWSLKTTCQVTCKPRTNVVSEFVMRSRAS
jgi:hypothetical protein